MLPTIHKLNCAQGLQAVLAAAYTESPPANGTAAAAQELICDLQSLLTAVPDAAAALPLAKPEPPSRVPSTLPGGPHQRREVLALRVGAAGAAAVKEAVRRAAGPCSRGILRHLEAVVSAVKAGGIKVRHLPPLPTSG